jgi:DmsE family decaheme c-type cytochrome
MRDNIRLLLVLIGLSAWMFGGDAKAGGYVGTDTCKSCHEEQVKNVTASPHAKTTFASIAGDPTHGCESCHGPGSAHVDGAGDKSKIFTFQGVSQREISQRCLTCHANHAEQSGFLRSSHLRADVSCLSCHSVHHAKGERLLVAKTNDLCFSCHGEMQGEFAKPSHHRVQEGLITCADCHNVHGAAQPKQVRTGLGGDAVCFKCHRDKQGPFVFEHLPVKTEGCSACHTPHGSSNPKLLTRSQTNTLCTECHGTATLPGLHNQSAKYAQCTLCHVAVHGSNTSNVLFKY